MFADITESVCKKNILKCLYHDIENKNLFLLALASTLQRIKNCKM